MISKLNQVDIKTICLRQFNVPFMVHFEAKRCGNSKYIYIYMFCGMERFTTQSRHVSTQFHIWTCVVIIVFVSQFHTYYAELWYKIYRGTNNRRVELWGDCNPFAVVKWGQQTNSQTQILIWSTGLAMNDVEVLNLHFHAKWMSHKKGISNRKVTSRAVF